MADQLITCISCPVGCQITVQLAGGQVQSLTGNQCKRGEVYARQEAVLPMRMVTAVAPVRGSQIPISLKTASPIPKDSIQAVMEAVRALRLQLPIQAGQVLLEDAAHTGVALIATKSLPQ